MRFEIRPFTSDDYEDVITLWRSSVLTIKPSDSRSELQKLCAFKPNRLLLAESNDEGGPKRISGQLLVRSMDAGLGFIIWLCCRVRGEGVSQLAWFKRLNNIFGRVVRPR